MRLLKSIFLRTRTWVGVDNFKLYDILIGKPIEKRGNATKSSLLKHYIICRMKIPNISKRECKKKFLAMLLNNEHTNYFE